MTTYLTCKRGDSSKHVASLQDWLNRCDYSCGPADCIFGARTEIAVEELEKHHNLPVDGIADPAVWYILSKLLDTATANNTTEAIDTYQEVMALEVQMPQTALDQCLSDSILMMQTCDGGQGLRYGGWINPYMLDSEEFDEGQQFIITKVGKVLSDEVLTQPIHGGTCSPFASMFLSWLYCVNEDYNFRSGRSARWLATWGAHHVYKGTKIPGLGDYSEVHGRLVLENRPLNVLYGMWEWLNKVNIVEMDHHIILILKVGGPTGLNLMDPATGEACAPGLYRLAADGFYKERDGKKYYSGTKQTFRRITATERTKQGWDVYRLDDLHPDTCQPTSGPWMNNKPWPLVLEP